MNRNFFRKVDNLYKRRFLIIVLFQIICVFILIMRIYYLQIISYNKYLLLSNINQYKLLYIMGERGNIFDRNNNLLTKNIKNYAFNEQKIDWDELVENMLKDTSFNKQSRSHVEYYNRYYNYPTLFSHIIGYTNTKKMNNLIEIYGVSGIEYKLNQHLTPPKNIVQYSLLNNNDFIHDKEKGKDIKLTLDLNLQKYVEEKMNDLPGSIVVLNVKTGEVLSMFSSPSYDTNEFVNKISVERWNELLNNPYKPLINKSINSRYPPGSTFKLIVALAALQNGWRQNKALYCSGKMELDKYHTLHCGGKHGHGSLRLMDAIKYSCNIYFSEIGMFAGINNIYNMAKEFGLGESYDLEIFKSIKGTLPNKEWKKNILKSNWLLGDTVNTSIGQGYVSLTPLELSVMVARIANGGYPIKPYIIYDSEISSYNKNVFLNKPIVNEEIINIVKNGMYKVVNEKGGTAFSIVYDRKYRMAGKTGTAQIISKKKYNNSNKKLANHGLFVGFAPFDNPKYAIAVVIENGISGALSAAPIAKDVLLFAQENNIGFNDEN